MLYALFILRTKMRVKGLIFLVTYYHIHSMIEQNNSLLENDGSEHIAKEEKINSLVVILLVSPEDEEIFSYRSECFDDDYAEYNLFTNKLAEMDYSNEVLFTSLNRAIMIVN